MPVPVQSAPGSIGEFRHVPEERWAAEPDGPEVRETDPSAGTTGTSASAGPTGPTRTDTSSSRSHRARLQDSVRVASDSGRKSRSLALPGICRVWASSMSARFSPVPAGSDNSACHQGTVPECAGIRSLTGAIGYAEVERVERNASPCRSNSCERYIRGPVSRGTPGTRSPESSGPPRARLFHVEHQVRDPQSRAGLLGRACFTWNTRYEIPRVERAFSNDCSGSEEWALCRDSHPPRIPIRCRTDLAEELVAKPIVEAQTGQRRKAEVDQARRWPT